MRLLCLNVALFEKNNQELIEFIKSQNVDILALQEVTKETDPNVLKDFISKDVIDSASLDLKYSYFSPVKNQRNFQQKDFHESEDFDVDFGGFLESGEYLKSRYKIADSQSVFVQGSFSKITDWSKWPAEDSKAFQIVDLEIKKKKLRIINYHGIWTKEKIGNELTKRAVQKIYEKAKEVSYPVIICGDFNLFPDSESMKILNDNFLSLVDKFNTKTTRPESNELSSLERNVVDYIFVSEDIKVSKFEVMDSNVSDHLPLILEFEI